jgi:uncharacterized membrane protein
MLIVNQDGFTYLVNTSRKQVESVRIHLDRTDDFSSQYPFKIDKIKKTVVFPKINPLSFICFKTSDTKFDKESKMIRQGMLGIINMPKATVYINFSENEQCIQIASNNIKVSGLGVLVKYSSAETERLEILKEISLKEIYRVKLGQIYILLREHLFLGRKFSTKDYFKDPGKIEDMSNW